jgi:predicted ATPase
MIHLRSIELKRGAGEAADGFPFTVPAIAAMAGEVLEFRSPVTFLVGENGSGKSTLLEGVAAAARAVAVGSHRLDDDPSLAAARRLGRALRLTWERRTGKGFYLRAEDFFGYARGMDRLRDDLERERRAIADDPSLSERARGLGQMPYARELGEIRRRYGEGLDARSHGESFLALFRARLVPGGLYLLDEPEAPLSPTRQLALLALLKAVVEEEGGQFVIATHSPILMAYPGATIYGFDGGAIAEVPYERLEHVTLTRDFLNNPAAFLRHL